MTDSKKSTNFRMDKLLRDTQNENILQKQQLSINNNINFWPFISSSLILNNNNNNQLTTQTIPIKPLKQQQQLSSSSFNLIINNPFKQLISSPFLISPQNNSSLFLNSQYFNFINNNNTINNLFQQKLNQFYQQIITPLSINNNNTTINSSSNERSTSSLNNNNSIYSSIKYSNNLKTTINLPLKNKKQEKISSQLKRIKNKELNIKETPKTTKFIKNNNLKKAQCNICGKLFGRPWLLNGHKRIHDGEKPFKCEWPECFRSFADRSNCRAHERTHRPEKPFICTNCGKAFKLKSYLSKHLRAKVCRQNN